MLFIIFLLLNHHDSSGDVYASFSCTGGLDSLLPRISFQIISCTSFFMLKVEVCEFLSTGTGAAYGEYGLNISLVAYPVFLDVNSCGLASVGQSTI